MQRTTLDGVRRAPKLGTMLLGVSIRVSVAFTALVAPILLNAQAPAGTRHISVVGTVHDSVANRPLEGALVQAVRTDDLRSARSTTSDSRGRFRFDSIVPAEYFISFFHAAVDSLGVQAPVRRVSLGQRDPERVELGLPGAERIIAALCPGLPPFDSSAVMVGDVRDVDTGAPIAGASITAEWFDFVLEKNNVRVEPFRARTITGPAGSFAMCGLPDEVVLRATSESRATGRLEIALQPRSIVRRDLTLAEGTTITTITGEAAAGEARTDTLFRGPARLSGTVLNESGRPVSDAVVEVWRTGLSTHTDASGRFELSALPVGTHVLEVRRIGFAPQHLPVQLAALSPTAVNVTLEKPVRLLDAVRVSARTLYSRRQLEIEQRRRRGFGHYIMRDELERNPAARVTDVLRRVPGVRVYSSPTGDVVTIARGVSFTGPCRPTVYLDGHRLGSGDDLDALASVNSLEAIEVYTSASQAPVEFWGGGCGAIVLWTRIEPKLPKMPKPKKEKEKPKTEARPNER